MLYEGRTCSSSNRRSARARRRIYGLSVSYRGAGVSNAQFLRLAYNEKMKHLGQEELDPLEFNDYLKEKRRSSYEFGIF